MSAPQGAPEREHPGLEHPGWEHADCRGFVIVNLGDPTLVARYALMRLAAGSLPAGHAEGLLRQVFGCLGSVEFYARLAAYLLVTSGRALDERWVPNEPTARGSYPLLRDWLTACLVEGRKSLPPVNDMQGVAFVATALDHAELHLRSIRALAAADRVSTLRAIVDAVFQARSRVWVLASSFTSHVGHFVYAATLLELQRRGRLSGPAIGILPGRSQNGFLRRLFEAHILAEAPADSPYAEMISARKRHRLADGSWRTMSELVSEAVSAWAQDGPFAALDEKTRGRGDTVLAALGVPPGAPVVTLHVREQGFHPGSAVSMRLRDARIADYRPAVGYLVASGMHVVRLGDRSMTRAEPQAGLVDYPFTDAKSDWMDIYLAARCRFHIGTSSGMSFVPLLFGRPALLTNWITPAHAVCSPSVLTLPKLLLDRRGAVVPAQELCDRHGHIFEAIDASLHGLTFRDNAPGDILDAVRLMNEHVDAASGRADFPPALFAEQQAVFAASALGLRPQIPPAFWRRHYGRA